MKNHKLAFTKALIVLVPSYLVAYLTEMMVYVVPTLAAAGFFASSIEASDVEIRRRVDEENDDADDLDFSKENYEFDVEAE